MAEQHAFRDRRPPSIGKSTGMPALARGTNRCTKMIFTCCDGQRIDDLLPIQGNGLRHLKLTLIKKPNSHFRIPTGMEEI